jgi:hypothetical protein
VYRFNGISAGIITERSQKSNPKKQSEIANRRYVDKLVVHAQHVASRIVARLPILCSCKEFWKQSDANYGSE